MKMYKGFDKNFQCRGFQYEPGKTYKGNEAKLCSSGFHACENPFDTFRYYSPGKAKYAEVELEDVTDERGDDSKRCGKKITIGAELNMKGVIEAGIGFIFEKVDFTKDKEQNKNDNGTAAASRNRGIAAASGDNGTAAASGDRGIAAASGNNGTAAASGDNGTAAASGNNGTAAASGDNSIAFASGIDGSAKATLGNFIVVSEWKEIDDKWVRVAVKSAKVDGVKIKADTFYKLIKNKFVEEI